jgi:exopolysaccharide production protein ExoY
MGEVIMANQPVDFADASENIDRFGSKTIDALGNTFGSAFYYKVGKRLLDLIIVVLTMPFWLTVIAVLAIFVARDGGMPFYSQQRIGKGGRVFTMWKLRSMVADADARLAAYLDSNPDARKEWDSTQKLRNDPRITRFGRLIRKTSMDELPQLFNVLKGEMSLVGPRPMMVDQQSLYPGLAYYRLLPGITGNWQITDRNNSTFAARAEFDRDYAANLSLTGDVSMLVRTVSVVLRATGC